MINSQLNSSVVEQATFVTMFLSNGRIRDTDVLFTFDEVIHAIAENDLTKGLPIMRNLNSCL